MWTNLRVGKHLQQRAHPRRVGRRLDARCRRLSPSASRLTELQQLALPRFALARRTGRAATGTRDTSSPRLGNIIDRYGVGTPEVLQGELVLHRPVPTRGHVVHRPPLGNEDARPRRDEPLRQHKVMRREALVRRGVGVGRIADQQLVEKRGPGPPVAQDEQRRLGELRPRRSAGRRRRRSSPASSELSAVKQVIEHVIGTRLGEIGEPIAGQLAHPRREPHAVPEARHVPGERVLDLRGGARRRAVAGDDAHAGRLAPWGAEVGEAYSSAGGEANPTPGSAS